MRYRIENNISYIVLLDENFKTKENIYFVIQDPIFVNILDVKENFRKIKFKFDGEEKIGWVFMDCISVYYSDDVFDGRFNSDEV